VSAQYVSFRALQVVWKNGGYQQIEETKAHRMAGADLQEVKGCEQAPTPKFTRGSFIVRHEKKRRIMQALPLCMI